jgi:hypothetical protein
LKHFCRMRLHSEWKIAGVRGLHANSPMTWQKVADITLAGIPVVEAAWEPSIILVMNSTAAFLPPYLQHLLHPVRLRVPAAVAPRAVVVAAVAVVAGRPRIFL